MYTQELEVGRRRNNTVEASVTPVIAYDKQIAPHTSYPLNIWKRQARSQISVRKGLASGGLFGMDYPLHQGEGFGGAPQKMLFNFYVLKYRVQHFVGNIKK
jgi:hypothetical protein